METSREMGLTLVIPFYSSSTAVENILTLIAVILHGGIVDAWGLFHYGVLIRTGIFIMKVLSNYKII